MDTYTVEQGRRGHILIARSAWNDEMAALIKELDLRELELNYAKGFKGKDLSFLQDLPNLEVLLLTHRTIDDIEPIHHLHKLFVLEVNTYCKSTIDFQQFPLLEECTLEWRAGAKSLFAQARLKKLFINSYSGRDMEKFGGLANLTSLGLANASVRSLEGLRSVKGLAFLGLYRLRKLDKLDGIEAQVSLEHLEVNECKNVRSIEPVAPLVNLKKLHLCDDGHIQSLAPISRLTGLEELLFYGSTHIVDGDLSPITQLTQLKKVWFEDRLHYSLTRREIQVYVGMATDEIQ